MRRLRFVLLLFLCPSLHAQTAPWAGVLAPRRAIDWSNVGVVGGIPNRTTICSSLTSTATTAQINSAIASCSNIGGGVVSLGAGTYSGVTSGFSFNGASNVTVRGAGANQTFLAPTSGITINASDNNWKGSPQNLTTWTVPGSPVGPYPQGTMTITLANERALSRARSPFRDVPTLLTYLEELVAHRP